MVCRNHWVGSWSRRTFLLHLPSHVITTTRRRATIERSAAFATPDYDNFWVARLSDAFIYSVAITNLLTKLQEDAFHFCFYSSGFATHLVCFSHWMPALCVWCRFYFSFETAGFMLAVFMCVCVVCACQLFHFVQWGGVVLVVVAFILSWVFGVS